MDTTGASDERLPRLPDTQFTASVYGGSAIRLHGIYIQRGGGPSEQAALGTFFHAVDTFFHGGVSFSHGIYFRLGGCEVKRGAT